MSLALRLLDATTPVSTAWGARPGGVELTYLHAVLSAAASAGLRLDLRPRGAASATATTVGSRAVLQQRQAPGRGC